MIGWSQKRETGFEPAVLCLGSKCFTTKLLPHSTFWSAPFIQCAKRLGQRMAIRAKEGQIFLSIIARVPINMFDIDWNIACEQISL